MYAHDPDSAPDRPHVGQVIDQRYRIVSLIGTGGMGNVYLAEFTRLSGRCAIKILHRQFSQELGIRRRFVNEANAAAGLEHDGVIKVFDIGSMPDGSVYMAMELLQGCDLAGHLSNHGGALPWHEAVDLTLQICRALEVAHRAGIVHRDLKPANCFVVPQPTGGQRVKILDFGIAKLKPTHDQTTLTQSGMIMGTPHYMSPEQARGQRVDHRTDIFAVGVILYELLTGVRPFSGATGADIMVSVLRDDVRPPTRVVQHAGLPRQLDEIVERALVKHADGRFPTMHDLSEALVKVVEGAVEGPKRRAGRNARSERVSSRRLKWALGSCVGLVAAAGTFWFAGSTLSLWTNGFDQKPPEPTSTSKTVEIPSEVGPFPEETHASAFFDEKAVKHADRAIGSAESETPDPPPENTLAHEEPPPAIAAPDPTEPSEADRSHGDKLGAPKLPPRQPGKAKGLLTRAMDASLQEQHARAYRLARESYHHLASSHALQIMGLASCKLGRRSSARFAYQRMNRREHRQLLSQVCASNGIDLN